MTQPSQRIFSYLTLPILKTIIKCSKLPPQTLRVVHWRAALSISATFKIAISHKIKRSINACGMVVHIGLYIPVSSSMHHSLLDLATISSVYALTHTHEP